MCNLSNFNLKWSTVLVFVPIKFRSENKNQNSAQQAVMDTDTEPNRKYRKPGTGIRYRNSQKKGSVSVLYRYRNTGSTGIRYLSSLFQNAPYSLLEQHVRPKIEPQRTTTHGSSGILLSYSYVVHHWAFSRFQSGSHETPRCALLKRNV